MEEFYYCALSFSLHMKPIVLGKYGWRMPNFFVSEAGYCYGIFTYIFQIFQYARLNGLWSVDKDESQNCLPRLGSFNISLPVYGGQCDSSRVSHEMNDNTTDSDVALSLFILLEWWICRNNKVPNTKVLPAKHWDGVGQMHTVYCIGKMKYS